MKRFLELLIILSMFFSCSQVNEPYIKEDIQFIPQIMSESYYSDMENPIPYLKINLSYNALGKLKKRTSVDYRSNDVFKFSEFQYNNSGVLSHIYDYSQGTGILASEQFELIQVTNYSYNSNGLLNSEVTQGRSDFSVESTVYSYDTNSVLSEVSKLINNDPQNHIEYDYDKHGNLEVKTILDKNDFVVSWFEYEYHNNLVTKMTLFNSRGIVEMEQFYHYNTYNQLILLEQNDSSSSKKYGTYVIRYEYQSDFDM